MGSKDLAVRAHPMPNKLRYFLSALTIFVLSAMVSFSVLIGYSEPRGPSRSSLNRLFHPMIVYSPFTLHKGIAVAAAEDALQIPVYGGSIPLELSTFGWRADHTLASSAGLVVVRLEANASLSTVNTWYQENFPKPFSQLRQKQILSGPAKERWFQKIDATVNSDAILYEATDSKATRGAILQPLTDSVRTGVILFYYSESRSGPG